MFICLPVYLIKLRGGGCHKKYPGPSETTVGNPGPEEPKRTAGHQIQAAGQALRPRSAARRISFGGLLFSSRWYVALASFA